MELVSGKEYKISYCGKVVSAIYVAKGGNEATGYNSHMFKLKRKQKFNVHGEGYPPKIMSYAFIEESELNSKILATVTTK